MDSLGVEVFAQRQAMCLEEPPNRGDVWAARRNFPARGGHVSKVAIGLFRCISHRCIRIMLHRPIGDVLTFTFRVRQQGACRVKVTLAPNGVWLNQGFCWGEAVGFGCALSLADSSEAKFSELSSGKASFRLLIAKPRTEFVDTMDEIHCDCVKRDGSRFGQTPVAQVSFNGRLWDHAEQLHELPRGEAKSAEREQHAD